MEWVRRTVGRIGWIVAGAAIIALAAQLDGSPGRFVASVQALTPLLVPVALVALLGGLWADRRAAGAIAIVLVALLIFFLPLATAPKTKAAAPSATRLRIASVNLLDTNDDINVAVDDVTQRNPDIIGFVEVTGQIGRALASHPIAANYPYQILLPGDGPTATRALWSRYPISQEFENKGQRYVLTAVAQTPDGPIRVVLAHIPSPFKDKVVWSTELGEIPDLVASSELPTIVMGDFNASYVHPPFRRMVSSAGLIDGLPAAGKRFTMTWPKNRIVWPFVTLDHVLVTPDLAVVSGDAFDVTGSDHAGVLITFAHTVKAPA